MDSTNYFIFRHYPKVGASSFQLNLNSKWTSHYEHKYTGCQNQLPHATPLFVQHGEALRSKRGKVLFIATHWGATGLEKGTQTLSPGSGIGLTLPTRTSVNMKLLLKSPKPVSPMASNYYPLTPRFTSLNLQHICSKTSVPSLNTCVNTKGSPAFREVPEALATVKSVW